jgi:signal peptidase I
MRTWRDYIENILIAVLLALFVRAFVLTGYKVPTGSMAPTLLPGDFIFSYRLPFGLKLPFSEKKIFVHPPRRGDVVVFTYSEQPQVAYVKRVIGLPGDRIEIKNDHLIVNEKAFKYEPTDEHWRQNLPNPELFTVVKEKGFGIDHELVLKKETERKDYGPIIVPPEEVFLLGDNRDSSDDSRYWGTVPFERIEGRVVFIWLSLNWQQKVWGNRLPTVRWDRSWSRLK